VRRFQASRLEISRSCSGCQQSQTCKRDLSTFVVTYFITVLFLHFTRSACLPKNCFFLLVNPAPAPGLKTRLNSLWRHGLVVRPVIITRLSYFIWGDIF
jgi:hypothetical protein